MRLRILPPLLVLIFAAGAPAVAEAGFSVASGEVGGNAIRTIRVADLGGDGKLDIVVFTDGPDGPGIHVYPADGEGEELGAASILLRPSEAGLGSSWYFFLARLSKGRGHEIVAVDKLMGVVALAVTVDKTPEGRRYRLLPPRPVARAPVVPFRPEPDRIHVLDAAVDLDGDGIDELILPSESGYEILRVGDRSEGAGRKPRKVPLDLAHELSSESHRFFALTWVLPRLSVADWDADGLPDLIAGHNGSFLVYLQREDGTFLQAGAPLNLLKIEPDQATRNTFTLGDVDGDKRADLLLTRSPTSIGLFEKFLSRQYLLLNPLILSTSNPGNLSTPACAIKTEGISVNPKLLDFDGDGDRDLLVTSLALDMKARMLKTVTAVYLLFRFDGEKKVFEQAPQFRVSRPFPIAQLERESTAPVCFFEGDFDGDGKYDLLDIADGDRITILKGTDDPGFLSSDSYGFKELLFGAELRLGNDVRILDLNGDGVSDIVGYAGSRLHVVRSGK